MRKTGTEGNDGIRKDRRGAGADEKSFRFILDH
jgi:hypothetical protein